MNALQEKLNTILRQAVDAKDIAGANLLVIKDGREVLYTQAGIVAEGRSGCTAPLPMFWVR